MHLQTVSIGGYRSLLNLRFAPGQLTLITGPNGVGKSNLYKALELLHHAAHGRLAVTLAREGGLASVQWAGPEHPMKRKPGVDRPQAAMRKKPIQVKLGVGFADVCYELTLGLPAPSLSAFHLDPEIKEELVWHRPPRRPGNTWLDRNRTTAKCNTSDGDPKLYQQLEEQESALSQLREPTLFPEAHMLRETLQGWRFYHGFRTDSESPLRLPQIGTRTPILSASGHDFAAALQTIFESGDREGMLSAVRAGLGGDLAIKIDDACRFEASLLVPGLLRPLGALELSDGSLKYLALIAALYSPRPASMCVLNEPEASLHPDLIAPLAASIRQAAKRSQVWVVSHHYALVSALKDDPNTVCVELTRGEDGATHIAEQALLDVPRWP